MLLRTITELPRSKTMVFTSAKEKANQAVVSFLAWLFTSLSVMLQDMLLGFLPIRKLLLRSLRPHFRTVLDSAMHPASLEPIPFDSLEYYVDSSAAQTLQFSALHALSVQLQAGEFLPPTQLLPNVSHVLLQTEERRGGKYLENIAAALASQMRGTFLPVDAMLLASLLSEALGSYPETYINMLRGGNGSSTFSSGGAFGNSRGRNGKSQRSESRIKLAWEALAEALSTRQAPVVVFLRSADALLCSSWENYSAFVSVFGAKSGEALTMEHETMHVGSTAPAPIVLIAGAIISETGAALVGSNKRGQLNNGGNNSTNAFSDYSDVATSSGAGIANRPEDSIRNLMAEEEEAAALDNTGQEDLGLAGLLLSLSKLTEEPKPNPRKLLARAFPTRVKLAAPPSGPIAARHRARLQKDVEEEAQGDNYRRASAVAAATGVKVPLKTCEVYSAAVGPGGGALRREDWEKVLAWAVSIETVQKKKEQIQKLEVAVTGARATTQQINIASDSGKNSVENIGNVSPEDTNSEMDARGKNVVGGKEGLRQRSKGNSGNYFFGGNNSNNATTGIRRVSSAVYNSQGYFTEDITTKSLSKPLLSPGMSPERKYSSKNNQRHPQGQQSEDDRFSFSLSLIADRIEGLITYLPGAWIFSRILSAIKSAFLGHGQSSSIQDATDMDINVNEEEERKNTVNEAATTLLDDVSITNEVIYGLFEPLELSEASLRYGLAMLRRSGGTPRSQIQAENNYEKQLLGEVLAPEDLGSGFASVGALQEAKRALREAVQLPLQRPDLFESGALARHSSGVLLFGPPGTGKTLLARATAAESGASFLELSLSSLSSKWYGDSTKLVRAAFTLAAKLAPCVLFVDEVDALLGRRSSGGREHEATRELKNEFMARWDSIRGDSAGQIMILGATNRPFDLDEAVLRRFSTRVAVPLPEKKARKEILEVVLGGQAIADDVNLDHVADRSEGFSGADLRQLCVAAAMRPIRDLIGDDEDRLKKERIPSNTSSSSQVEVPPAADTAVVADGLFLGALASPQMASALANATSLAQRSNAAGCPAPRPVTAADFEAARREVGPTVDPDSSVIQELKEWDSKYGSVGARSDMGANRRLLYYT